nr:MAG TPA: hypothetical protein [Caudoviricetes sp.]DAR06502.1 MAG TPA: hypothetical protein [Caudoviricetes sp.]
MNKSKGDGLYRPSLNLLLSISFLVIYYISEKLLYFQKEEVL